MWAPSCVGGTGKTQDHFICLLIALCYSKTASVNCCITFALLMLIVILLKESIQKKCHTAWRGNNIPWVNVCDWRWRKGSNKSCTQRSSPLHLLSAVGLLSVMFTRSHIHLLFIPNYSLSLILTPRVNEVGGRRRESGGLMDLIGGVALIISRETTRYWVREKEWGRSRENNSNVSIHRGKVPLRGRRQKMHRKTERGRRRMLCCCECRHDVTLVYLHQTGLRGDSTCVSWVKLCVYGGINVCSSLSCLHSPPWPSSGPPFRKWESRHLYL